MKNLFLVLADLALNRGNSYRWIAALTMGKLRTLSMVMVFSILCLTVISSALNMVLSDLQRATESQQQLAMTSISAIGLGVIIFSLTAICLFFRKSVWGLTAPVDTKPKVKLEPYRETPSITNVLSMLVMDFVDTRKNRRERKSRSEEEMQAGNA